MTVQLDLQQLRGIAEKATPGPWIIDSLESGEHGIFIEEGNPDYGRLGCASSQVAGFMVDKNAEHIATFDPPTILRLLDRLEQAEKTVEQLQAHRDVLIERRDEWMHRADTAETAITAVREFAEGALEESNESEASGETSGWDVEIDARTILTLLPPAQTTNHEIGRQRD